MSTTKKALSLSAASAVLAFAMLTAPAHAAEVAADTPIATASADDASEVDAIVVQGFRKSLGVARQMKRDSSIVADVIVAEDMAKFPDLNLAESLQRLPGVAINREAGEGRRVSLRGLGPDYTRVQLNGMEVLGNVDSPMDSRGQTSRDRAFDFNIFASELFSKIDVRKSFSAEQDEGGMAGTVGLYTAKPFAYDGRKMALSLQGGTNSATEDFQPRVAGMFSQNFDDKFGVLVSVAYSKRQVEEQGYNTYGAGQQKANAANVVNLSASDALKATNGELIFQRGNRLSVWGADNERLGVTTALQWRPVENVTLTLDGLYGKFSNDRSENHLATRASVGSTILGAATPHSGVTTAAPVLRSIQYDQYNTIIYADVANTVFATETRRQETENTFKQLVLTGEWEVSDKLKFDGHIGQETSDYDIPISDKFYTEAFGDLITDYRGKTAKNIYGWDTTDPNNYRAHEIDFSATYQTTKLKNAEFNGSYQFDDTFTLKGGVSFRGFENSGYTQTNDDVNKTAWEKGTLDDHVNSYYKIFREHDDQSWLIVDWNKALAAYNVTRTLGAPKSIYAVQEDTNAGYLQLDWKTELAGMRLRGNVGARAYDTELTSTGVMAVRGVNTPTTVKKSYSGVLPAFNAVLEVNDQFQIRAAAAQNINRPSLAAYAMNGSISVDGSTVTVSSGNPNLDPYTSDEFDLSAEWYFGSIGMLTAGVFHKKIDNLVSSTTTNALYSDTGLAEGLVTGVTASTPVIYTRSVNNASATLSGLELSAQSDFFFLPGPLKNLGMVANLTLIDSETTNKINGKDVKGQIYGLSDVNTNITLYYETTKWGARVSSNYRSDYTIDSGGFEATTYVDAAAFYQLSPRIRLTLDGVNLTDEREAQYNSFYVYNSTTGVNVTQPGAHRLWNHTKSGRTVFFGANIQF
ncbi:TonB-dependent receptor [Caulobacter sp. D4A]|uniref:TonB-dependent receptor n=1 Tax=unclassified Caulobacter TaxID=2648921 RepID=UPI000D739AD6|nr:MULTISPECIES: TonB-dependent receptor [unclassified Caulobacter]PXA82699.1 TonB-dependent receptor [Caulobacter sp. D4A]PXA96476.1 TonB-dependent receptor [Caulobacter sp. D5]